MDTIQLVYVVYNGFKKPTKEAADLKAELEKRGVKVLVEVNDGFKRIDLGLPEAKLNIEVDGIQHLTNPNQIIADLNRGYYSGKLGYKTMHISNEMIRSHLNEIADALAGASKIIKEKMQVHLADSA